MIALDTNILVRLLVEDDPAQASAARRVVVTAEAHHSPLLVLPEVLVETAWVLASGYGYGRADIADALAAVLATGVFEVPDREAVRAALDRYRERGDMADHLIVARAAAAGARLVLSFDRKLQRLYPGLVREPATDA